MFVVKVKYIVIVIVIVLSHETIASVQLYISSEKSNAARTMTSARSSNNSLRYDFGTGFTESVHIQYKPP
eukprot:COSAG02_NODE_3103_length_7367_cov_108.506742_5_plen_70_part_00